MRTLEFPSTGRKPLSAEKKKRLSAPRTRRESKPARLKVADKSIDWEEMVPAGDHIVITSVTGSEKVPIGTPAGFRPYGTWLTPAEKFAEP